MHHSKSLVDRDWLHENLDKVRIFDGSFYLGPDGMEKAITNYNQNHIEGAQFFNIDEIADQTSPYPHTLPNQKFFSDFMRQFGIHNDDFIVIYDQQGGFSAARIWWMFRVFGHEKVAILDGGLPFWQQKYPTHNHVKIFHKSKYNSQLKIELLATYEQVLNYSRNASHCILDARSSERFMENQIPNSQNLFFRSFFDENGCFFDKESLSKILSNYTLKKCSIKVCTCGSGVTACWIAFVAYYIDGIEMAVYDGSWTEWSDKQGKD